MSKTVYLVNAGNDDSMASIANDYSFPPLNILALGTWLKQETPEVDVTCRDAGIIGTARICAEIRSNRPWLVGVGVLATSYQSALQIAAAAKSVGAWTVFGNDQAAHMSRLIIEHRPTVDFVVGAEYGEQTLSALVRKLLDERDDFETVPALTWRDANGAPRGFDYASNKADLSILSVLGGVKGKRRQTALDIYPIVDRNLYQADHWNGYLSNYLEAFGHLHPDRQPSGVTTMNRARGCSRANEKIKCKHCDMLLDIAFSSPARFWDEVRSAHRQVGSDVFYEVCDSLTSFGTFIDHVARSRPVDLGFDPMFFIYGQALDLVRKPEMARHLREMGVFKINIGLESGSEPTLQHMKGPKDSVAANYEALKLVRDQGIHVYGSFVLGTEMETPETLRETVDWIKRIIDEDLISDVEAQPILPLYNNHYGNVLFADYVPEGDPDWPVDIDRVAREYVTRYSGVSYDDCIKAAREIRLHAAGAQKNFGSGVSKAENYATA